MSRQTWDHFNIWPFSAEGASHKKLDSGTDYPLLWWGPRNNNIHFILRLKIVVEMI